MNKLIRYFNQNRKKIFLVVIIIVSIILFTRLLNYIIKEKNKAKIDDISNSIIDKDTTIPSDAIISDTKIPKEKATSDKKLIESFVTFCNEEKWEEAYAILSDSCKENVFQNDINQFKTNYTNTIFKTDKIYKLEGWVTINNSYTYKITYMDNNLLATGGVSTTENYTDYITVLEKNNETKLSIKSFINEQKINNAHKTTDNINIQINSKKVYMEYEIYNITVKNNTDKNILLTDGQSNNQICLLDKSKSEHISYINETPFSNFIISAKTQKTFEIKFSNFYATNIKIQKMMFKKIYMDYNSFMNEQNKNNLSTIQIEINI